MIDPQNETHYFSSIEVFGDIHIPCMKLTLEMTNRHNKSGKLSLIAEKISQFCNEAVFSVKSSDKTRYQLIVTLSSNQEKCETLFDYIKKHTIPKIYRKFSESPEGNSVIPETLHVVASQH